MLYWFWSFDSIGGDGAGMIVNHPCMQAMAGETWELDVEFEGVKDHKIESIIYMGF